MRSQFQASRSDGRSDRQVVFEMVRGAEPETVFPYERLSAALQENTGRPITRGVVCAAARAASRPLERECQRTLSVVPRVGYRVVRADEHLGLALNRKDRAELMIRRGVELLQNTRVDELNATQLALHNGQMLVLGGFYEALRSTRRRQDAQERVIRDLVTRIGKLEGERT